MTPERKGKLLGALNKRQPGLAVVLENVEDPRNVTAVMRSCDAVGIQDIYIITTEGPRPEKYKFVSGRSAEKWVTLHHFDNLEACVAVLRSRYQRILTTSLTGDSVSIYDVDFTQSTALVLGNERRGVSEAFCALADGNINIPMAGMLQSLNISVACAVCIYEAYRQKKAAGHYDAPALPEARMAELKVQWSEGYKEGLTDN
ncbi:tRNA (guanosine-2'-O-)-methyltransferase [Filimonas lacunae]|uniref:tRNA (guanosine(18)-2'-O)-methyltransferase n=1 Tax=Filimonas lacunae TaxID=477680 RepID=A0A173MIY1_9BACT|nr:RNA methyltransferase [Filimonas lacunae]BAV07602.1 tRNA (guanosine(18)-2'-O)-methyltransferase [Filimonas lacunae]SIT29819.1 tRNA (guanosine-2'-O-)-methyltransferase [Filimonas lacunae]